MSFKSKGGEPTLTFHRNGSASETGVAYLRPLEGSLSQSPYAVRAVTVERATAEVRCHSFRTGSWADQC